MINKRILLIFISFCFLLFSFTACKHNSADTNSDESDSTAEAAQNGENGQTSSDIIVDTNGDGIIDSNDIISSNGKSGSNYSSNDPGGFSGGDGGSGESMPYFNVRDYGAAGNGSSDDSSAVQSAIAAAQSANGGIVYIPAGVYLMGSGIDVPMGVSVRGEAASTTNKWRSAGDLGTGGIATEAAGSDWLDSSNFSGTWILVDHGQGDADSHATFELQGNASIFNLGFVYKNTAPVVSSIAAYPPAIGIKNVASNPYTRDGMTIENIVLLNAYIGIGIQAGNGSLLDHQDGQEADLYSMGRMRVHNITGGCVYRGIIMKGLLDTVDLQNISFGYTNMEATYANYRANNCADLEWYRADGTNATNIFSFGAKYGILTTPAFSNGSTSMRLSNSELIGQYPCYISATGQYEIENCTFATMNFDGLCSENNFQAMTVIQDTTSIHQPFYTFSQLTLVDKVQSNSATDIPLYLATDNPSATAMVVFSNSTFSGWSPDTTDPIIYYETPSTNYGGFASFYNCAFQDGSSDTGMLFSLSNVTGGGLQFNGCSIPDTLINNSNNINNAVWFN